MQYSRAKTWIRDSPDGGFGDCHHAVSQASFAQNSAISQVILRVRLFHVESEPRPKELIKPGRRVWFRSFASSAQHLENQAGRTSLRMTFAIGIVLLIRPLNSAGYFTSISFSVAEKEPAFSRQK